MAAERTQREVHDRERSVLARARETCTDDLEGIREEEGGFSIGAASGFIVAATTATAFIVIEIN